MKLKMILLISGVLIFVVGLIFFLNPFLIWNAGSTYKTQKIIYRNKNNRNIKIEFQMKDLGAFGYNRRIVKVKPCFFFNFTDNIDTTELDKNNWIKVDEYINELGLKGG